MPRHDVSFESPSFEIDIGAARTVMLPAKQDMSSPRNDVGIVDDGIDGLYIYELGTDQEYVETAQ